jgi:hypothetical protein
MDDMTDERADREREAGRAAGILQALDFDRVHLIEPLQAVAPKSSEVAMVFERYAKEVEPLREDAEKQRAIETSRSAEGAT